MKRNERSGTPVTGARDELVEEPSNIFFTTKTGSETTRYDAMSTAFWIECLDLMEAAYDPPIES